MYNLSWVRPLQVGVAFNFPKNRTPPRKILATPLQLAVWQAIILCWVPEGWPATVAIDGQSSLDLLVDPFQDLSHTAAVSWPEEGGGAASAQGLIAKIEVSQSLGAQLAVMWNRRWVVRAWDWGQKSVCTEHWTSWFERGGNCIVANYPGLTGRLPVFLAFPGLPPVYSIAIEFPRFFLELLHKPT